MDGFTLAALTSAMHSFNSKTVMSWSFAATSECGTSVITSPIMLSTLYTTMARTNKNDTEIKGEMHLLTS